MKYISFLFSIIVATCIYANDHAKDSCERPKTEEFRNFKNAPSRVQEFYRLQHTHQTYAFAEDQTIQFADIMQIAKNASEVQLQQMESDGKIKRMTIWEALLELDNLIDESDPDLSLPNSVHALQVAEAIRADLKSTGQDESMDWFILIGLLHDIGKVDALLRNVPQWAVVGDTFPVGCQFSDKNVFVNFFNANPDSKNSKYNSALGIYTEGIGLDNVVMSWGHDEYGYGVFKAQGTLPREALSMMRFHSFYPLYREGAYLDLLDWKVDIDQVLWIRKFNPYDLYSKSSRVIDREALSVYYRTLINKYFPPASGESEKRLIWPILNPIN